MPITEHRASEMFQDLQIHFHIVVLDRQLLIWIGVDPPCLANMVMAMPTHMDPTPSATSLLGPLQNENISMSQRLARKVGKPVALSVNLPSNEPLMRAFAERRLVQELQQLDLVHQAASLTLQPDQPVNESNANP